MPKRGSRSQRAGGRRKQDRTERGANQTLREQYRKKALRDKYGPSMRPAPVRRTEPLRARPLSEAELTWWYTPAVDGRPCGVCGEPDAVAYRHMDQACLCELCVERLGVEPRMSKRARQAG